MLSSDLAIIADAPPGGLAPESLNILWDAHAPDFTAPPVKQIEPTLAAYVEDARLHHKSLCDGRVTRLIEARSAADSITLRLGPASYKSFVVTTLRDRAWFDTYAPEARIRALGNSVLLTHRGRAILGIR